MKTKSPGDTKQQITDINKHSISNNIKYVGKPK